MRSAFAAAKSARTIRTARGPLALAVAALLACPLGAQTVIDGDSLRLKGVPYRLHGVDAPDPSQVCPDGWPAGYEAENYLRDLIEDKDIACTPVLGKYEGEIVALCRADGVDLGAAMVTGGRAFAFVPYSARYISEESAAAAARRGVHAHHCLSPAEWRARLLEGR